MAITTIGRHSPCFKANGPGGVGAPNLAPGMGWLSVTASEAGDIAIIDFAAIVHGDVNQGVFFQSIPAATVEFTLANPGLVFDRRMAAEDLWGNSTALVSKVIKVAPVIFTACKITFAAAGTLYIGTL